MVNGHKLTAKAFNTCKDNSIAGKCMDLISNTVKQVCRKKMLWFGWLLFGYDIDQIGKHNNCTNRFRKFEFFVFCAYLCIVELHTAYIKNNLDC